MNVARAVVVASLVVLCGSRVHAQTIDWEVTNRFRVVTGETWNDRLIARLLALRTAGKYRPLIDHPPGLIGLGSEANVPTSWSERHEQYNIAWVHQKTRRVRVSLKGVATGSTCRWSRDGQPQSGTGCGPRSFADVPLDKVTPVSVEVRKGATARTLHVDVAPKDLFVALIGDSTGSGEGNPHLKVMTGAGLEGYPAIWWDARCHRSLLSGGAQAAAFHAERNRKISVTFVSYACSGAEIMDGILTPFTGRETVPQVKTLWELSNHPNHIADAIRNPDGATKEHKHKLKAQVDRLAEILCPPKPGSPWVSGAGCAAADKRVPDLLIVAVGGNDVAFAEVAAELILSSPDDDSPQGLTKWEAAQKARIGKWFDKLDGDFAKLAEAVRSRVAPARVLLLEYLNPARYTNSAGKEAVCGEGDGKDRLSGDFGTRLSEPQKRLSYGLNSSLYNLLLTRGEGKFADWVVTELNDRVRKGATRQWTEAGPAAVAPLQDLKGKDGLPRGICAKDYWFVTITESYIRQDWLPVDKINTHPLKLKDAAHCKYDVKDGQCWVPSGNITTGILHPNFFGHYNASTVILKQMEVLLPKP